MQSELNTINHERQFWREVVTGNETRVQIVSSDLIKFIEGRGYRKLVSKRDYQLVKIVDGSIVRPVKEFLIRDEIKMHLSSLNKESVWEEFCQADYLSKRITEGIESITIDFNYGDENNAFFFYKNGVVKVSSNDIEIISFSNYDGYVWEEQIQDRDFIYCDSYQAEFRKFCWNLSKQNSDRFQAITTIIGYLLHSHKDPALTKAIIFMDENIDLENNTSEGGTGKSILSDAIMKVIPGLKKNGKNLKTNDKFFFADVEPHHKIIVFDDVKVDFQFESLYSMITGDLPIEKKYKNPTVTHFNEAPKVLITSNYVVKGTGGNSELRRKVEFEVSSHYRLNISIVQEFGHRFFDDWDIDEWLQFDNFMIECVQMFLNNGIIEPEPININQNRVIQDTNLQFAAFLDLALQNPEEYMGEVNRNGVKFNKASLYRLFITQNPECSLISAIQFKKWIDTYCKIKEINVHHFKSDSQNYVIFQMNNNQSENSEL